jgi:pimeloyl-ACP methyl ester carboxylesterase
MPYDAAGKSMVSLYHDERFVHLPEFPCEPHYAKVNGFRVYYLDEGQDEIILCLHGEPSCSFLYRKMIPILSAIQRVVVRQARAALATWQKPALVMFSDSDPIMRGGDVLFRRLIPTAHHQPRIKIQDAGHFLQEEKGKEIAQHIVEFIRRTPN